jgi:hypothetical protein
MLIRPAGIDTPAVDHARNYLDVEPRLPAPVYAPDVVARVILHAAEHQTRDVFAGGAARLLVTLTHLAPDWVMRKFMFEQVRTDRRVRERRDGLHDTAGEGLREHGGSERWVRETSLHSRLAMHPVATWILGYGLGIAAVGALLRSSRARTIARQVLR